ncbi:MAG: histidine kinase [Saprospiraceae bacterium]|nr:histidine kinase [Saprospiraceae bacterium]
MNLSFLRKRSFQVFFAAIILLVALRLFTSKYEPSEKDLIPYLSTIWVLHSILLVFIFNFAFDRGLNRILPWKKYAGSRFLIQMILGTAMSLLSLNLSYNLIKDEFTSAPPDTGQMLVLNVYGFAIILPLFSLFFGFKFLRAWRKSELESEQLQKENVRSQMMTLRNHLDPHFLFNNLNILSSLIDKNTELSKSYLDKFAEVYRIILKTEFSDLSLLEDEMRLIDSYCYLLKIRFEKAVFIDKAIDQQDMIKAIPPLSIQMLVENAIKHNMASEENPIRILIESTKDGFIEVSNNLQEKKYLPTTKEGTGLENIKKRFEFFTDREVIIEKSDEQFNVKLPLLEIEYD